VQTPTLVRPDGDVDLVAEACKRFVIPPCLVCGQHAILKPAVVFHGGNVAKDVADTAASMVADAAGVLVVGTTLTTFSSYRLVLAASAAAKPIVIINNGATRADALQRVAVGGSCAAALSTIAASLGVAVPTFLHHSGDTHRGASSTTESAR
jgi:NAD-dependent deacetylase sirtuin 4